MTREELAQALEKLTRRITLAEELSQGEWDIVNAFDTLVDILREGEPE